MTNTVGSRPVLNLFPIDVGSNAQPTLVDLDGDGILDALVGAANTTSGVTWNYYNGATQGQSSTFSLFNNATSLVFSDIDGDGDADAVGVDANGSLLYYRNDGLGRFISLTGTANPFNNLRVSAGSQLTFANGNLIATSAQGVVQQFSSSLYSGVRQWRAGGSFDFTGIDRLGTNAGGLGANARPTFVDLDQDGDMDIVVGGADGKIRYYESFRGKFYEQIEKFNPFQKINLGGRTNASPTIVDIDGNGNLDLIVGKGDGTIEQYRDLTAQFYRPVWKAPKFATPEPLLRQFAPLAGGWSSFDKYPRQVADVNGDGRADIVAFGEYDVCVALRQADGTFAPNKFLPSFTPSSGGWSSFNKYPRQVADVNGDRRADIVGFGEYGVSVALGQADGTFGSINFVLANFAPSAGGWSSFDKYPRQVADVNGDGRADIVAFGESAVAVALGQANGSFATPIHGITGFTPGAGRWLSFNQYPRQLADVNGDGRADIVGFGESAVVVALGQANGSFGTSINAYTGLTTGVGRWLSYNRFPRQMGDVNGDGRADIVAFGESGVFVALGQLDGTFIAPHQYNTLGAFTEGAGRWTSFDAFPRQVADVDGDGRADVVGFGESGVSVALNQTPQLPRNADLVFGLDFKTSGQGIWGNTQARHDFADTHSFSVQNTSFNSLDVGIEGIGSAGIQADVEANLSLRYGYELDLGSLNATLPIQTWFDLPDQIRAGQTITIKSGYQFDEMANFFATAPHLKTWLEFMSQIAIKNAGFEVGGFGASKSWDFPDIDTGEFSLIRFEADTSTGFEVTGAIPDTLNRYQEIKNLVTGQFIEEAEMVTVELSGADAGTNGKRYDATRIAGYSDTRLLKANLDIDYLTALVLQQSPSAKMKAVGEGLAKIEGTASVDLGIESGEVAWNLFDEEFSNQLYLRTDLTLMANNLTGFLTLEDGRKQNFIVGQDLTFNVGADLNGDGFIQASATVDLQATVWNNTYLSYQGSLETTYLEASVDVGLLDESLGPLFSPSSDVPGLNATKTLYEGSFPLGGLNRQSFSFALPVGNLA